MNVWISVFRADATRILRDPMLFFMMVSPFLLGLVVRWGLPELSAMFADQFDLTDYYPLIIAICVLIPAFYIGAVMALQIIDEKDEHSLLAVAVTPFSLRRYFVQRIFMYTVISIPVVILVHQLIGLVAISALKLWAVAIVSALQAPLIALVVAGFASNQVEGFAMMKGSGILGILPLSMFFVPDYWHVFCGILPSYWPVIAYFTATKAGGSELFFWVAIVGAFAFQAGAVYYLYHRFENNVLGRR